MVTLLKDFKLPTITIKSGGYTTVVDPNVQSRLWDLIWGAGPMVKLVLLLLFAMSVFSWAIIFYKTKLLKTAEKETEQFYDLFWKKRDFELIQSLCKNYKNTPLSALFNEAVKEIPLNEETNEIVFDKRNLGLVRRILKKTTARERARLESSIDFLATTGSTAPFIGLFGTVWGIMNAFRGIGVAGSASLAVVAPGIAEALIATAMGLFAAIPAVIAYNNILTKTDNIFTEADSFSSDLLNMLEKESNN